MAIVQQPNGQFYDPATGQWYADAGGSQPIATPPRVSGPSPAGVYTTAQPSNTIDGSGNIVNGNGTTGFHGTVTSGQDSPTLGGALGAVGIVDPLAGAGLGSASGIGGAVGSLVPGLSDASKASLASAVGSTNNYSQFYGNQLVNYNPVAAPVAASPAAIQAAIAQQGAPIQAGTATASNATAANIGSTALAQQQAAIQAQQVQAAQIAQTAYAQQQAPIQGQQITAPKLAPSATASPYDVAATRLAPTTLTSAANIDAAQQAQFRAQQQGLAGSLQGTINGTTPSVAALMLRNATDNAVSNQYALAQAASGMNAGEAQRQAMLNAAQLNSSSIYQQALLRAQEIATAQGQLGGVLDQGRGADLSLATNQAGLQQQTNLANAGATNATNLAQGQINAGAAQANAAAQNSASQFNASSFNQQQQAQAALTQGANLANQSTNLAAGTTNASLAQQVALANAGATNTTNATNAQLSQAASLANQQANLTAGTTNATLAQQVALANAAATNTTNQTNAGYQQAANLQNSQLATQASLANANNTTSANTASAQLANAVNLANANNQSQANLTTGQLQTQTNLANANNAVSTNALNQKAVQDLASNQLTASGQNVTASNNQAQADVGLASAAAQAKGAEYQALATGIAGGSKLLTSDRRQKTDISRSEKEIAAFVRGINPYAWKYKDPTLPGAAPGRRFGVMAQDLERSKVGRSMVHDGPDGVKRIDVGSAATVALAAISAINKRLDRAGVRA